MAKKYKCMECCEYTDSDLILTVGLPHPKHPAETVHQAQCPDCGVCNMFDEICDEPLCKRSVACGWPSADGYRHTCDDHVKN